MATKSRTNKVEIDLAVMAAKIDNIEHKVNEIDSKLEKDYATKEWCDSKYGQTVKVVNGILITFGLAIIGALATFVIGGGLK